MRRIIHFRYSEDNQPVCVCVCETWGPVYSSTDSLIENGVCAFKAPDCLSLSAAERLTPSGHSGHLSGGRTPSWRSSKRKQPHYLLKRRVANLQTALWWVWNLFHFCCFAVFCARFSCSCVRVKQSFGVSDQHKRGEETRSWLRELMFLTCCLPVMWSGTMCSKVVKCKSRATGLDGVLTRYTWKKNIGEGSWCCQMCVCVCVLLFHSNVSVCWLWVLWMKCDADLLEIWCLHVKVLRDKAVLFTISLFILNFYLLFASLFSPAAQVLALKFRFQISHCGYKILCCMKHTNKGKPISHCCVFRLKSTQIDQKLMGKNRYSLKLRSELMLQLSMSLPSLLFYIIFLLFLSTTQLQVFTFPLVECQWFSFVYFSSPSVPGLWGPVLSCLVLCWCRCFQCRAGEPSGWGLVCWSSPPPPLSSSSYQGCLWPLAATKPSARATSASVSSR